MRTVAVLLTVAAFALSVPAAMARDANRDALQQTWKAQQVEQQAAQKKVEEVQVEMTVKVQPAKADTGKTK